MISFNYPKKPTKKNIKYYKSFMKNLEFILPCKKCRDHYIIHMKNLDGYSDKHYKNRKNFSKFIYKLHNYINISLNKKKYKNYEYVENYYELLRYNNKDNYNLSSKIVIKKKAK